MSVRSGPPAIENRTRDAPWMEDSRARSSSPAEQPRGRGSRRMAMPMPIMAVPASLHDRADVREVEVDEAGTVMRSVTPWMP